MKNYFYISDTNVSDAVSSGNSMGFVDGNTNPALDDYEYDSNDFRVKDFEKVFCEETERSSEWQDELNLNMYDMDMRQYDPAIARWVVMDPVIHHSMSPYSAFDNNPVFWADPSGAAPEIGSVFEQSGMKVASLMVQGTGTSIGAGGAGDGDSDRNPTKAEQYAKLSDHVYGAEQGQVVDGWTVESVTNHEGKGQTGYRSAIYSKDGKYVLAFAGTDPGSMADLKTDIQAIVSGKSEQFETALQEARSAVGKYGGENVEFTGHSLGGGLASAASLDTGSKAVTFNALGLSNTLKDNLGILSGDSKKINAFVVKGEFVDYYQSAIGLRAEGNRKYLPSGVIWGGMPQRLMLHMMGSVQPKLESYIDKQIESYKKIKN